MQGKLIFYSKCIKLSDRGWSTNSRIIALTKSKILYFSKIPKNLDTISSLSEESFGKPKQVLDLAQVVRI